MSCRNSIVVRAVFVRDEVAVGNGYIGGAV